MLCPVCGHDHIADAESLVSRKSDLFSPCPECARVIRNKSAPPGRDPSPQCRCGKSFIDDVYAGLYHILVDAGIFSGEEPLSAVGTPLIHPGMFLRAPPFLPPRSLLLISPVFDACTAARAYRDIPQICGILRSDSRPPGIGDLHDGSVAQPVEHTLLCGCDVRADLFPTSRGPVVIYKKQGSAHIEFPHGIDPKIRSVEAAVRKARPSLFVDCCAGAGTLGIAGAILGVPHLILNDPWYSASYFSAFNLLVNKKAIGLDECTFSLSFDQISREKVQNEPRVVASCSGPDHECIVYQGRMELLSPHITRSPVLTVFDPFDKARLQKNHSFVSFWQQTVGGEVFIP